MPSYSPFKGCSFHVSSSKKPALTTHALRSRHSPTFPCRPHPSASSLAVCVLASPTGPGWALSYPSHVLASNTGRARPRPADLTWHGLAGHCLHAQPYHRLWEQVGTDPPAGGSEEPESQAGRLSISSQPPAKGPEREDIINPVPTLPLPAAGTESSSAPSPGPNITDSTDSGVRHGHGPRTGRHARSPTGRGRGKDCSGCAHC